MAMINDVKLSLGNARVTIVGFKIVIPHPSGRMGFIALGLRQQIPYSPRGYALLRKSEKQQHCIRNIGTFMKSEKTLDDTACMDSMVWGEINATQYYRSYPKNILVLVWYHCT